MGENGDAALKIENGKVGKMEGKMGRKWGENENGGKCGKMGNGIMGTAPYFIDKQSV